MAARRVLAGHDPHGRAHEHHNYEDVTDDDDANDEDDDDDTHNIYNYITIESHLPHKIKI